MINTIFYFPDNLSFEDYNDLLRNGEIADHTIVFSSGNKSIYKGGVLFGSVSYQDLATIINQIFEDRHVDLPIATETLLGAIKVGSGLDVLTDGLLSVDSDDIKNIIDNQYIKNIINGQYIKDIIDNQYVKDIINNQYIESSYTLPVATSSILGGVKIGNNITVDSGKISLSKNNIINALGYTPAQSNNVTEGSSGLMTAEDKDKLNSIEYGANKYILPAASSDTLGGIKIGNGLTVSDGVLSITSNNDGPVPYDAYTKEEIDNKVNIINSAIDAVTESVNSIDGALDEEKTRLTNLVNALDTNIQNKVESMFDDANWIQLNWPEGTTGSTSNFGESDVEAYLQEIGVWARNDEITSTNWSDLSQKVNSIEAAVNAMSSSGEITEDLRASIEAVVEDEVANLDIATTYAKKDDVGAVLEWMYSGLKSSAASDLTYNNLISAANNNTNGNFGISALSTEVENIKNNYVAKANLSALVADDIQSSISGLASKSSLLEAVTTLGSRITTVESQTTALSGLETRVTTLEDAEYLALANLVAAIKANKDEIISQAGLVAKSTYDSAISGINTKLTTLEDGLSGIAGLTTLVNDINGKYVSQTELISKIVEGKDNLISQAGLATSAEVNTAKAELSTSISNLSSNVYTKTETNGAILTAVAGISVEGPDLSGYVKKAEIIASVNNTDLGSNVKINADKINVGGITIQGSQISDINEVIANKVTADYVNALGITANTINLTEGSISGWTINDNHIDSLAVDTYKVMKLSPSDGITVYNSNNNTTYTKLSPDGSGSLASGGITWDTVGNMTISANGLLLDTSRDWVWSASQENANGLGALLIGPKKINNVNIENIANARSTSVLIASDTPRIDFYCTGLTYNGNATYAMTGLYNGKQNVQGGWDPSNPYAYGIQTNANIVLDGAEVYVDSAMKINGNVYSGNILTGTTVITLTGITFRDSSNNLSKVITWNEIYDLLHSSYTA